MSRRKTTRLAEGEWGSGHFFTYYMAARKIIYTRVVKIFERIAACFSDGIVPDCLPLHSPREALNYNRYLSEFQSTATRVIVGEVNIC